MKHDGGVDEHYVFVCDALPHSQTPSDCLWRPDLFPPPADTQKETGLITSAAANFITRWFVAFQRASLPAWLLHQTTAASSAFVLARVVGFEKFTFPKTTEPLAVVL